MKGNQNKFINVKVAMTKAGINVSTVASEMGISPQALYQKLNGKSEFTLKDINAVKSILSKHLGENLTLEDLFGGNYDN